MAFKDNGNVSESLYRLLFQSEFDEIGDEGVEDDDISSDEDDELGIVTPIP